MTMDDKNKVDTITFFDSVDGDIYPEKDLPENARKLRGFVWRGDERIKTKEEIYPPDEVELDKKIVADSNKKFEKEKVIQEIEKNKLEAHVNGDEFYEKIFRKYNNHLIIDKNGVLMLVRNSKFMFPADANSIVVYKKKHPLYKKEDNLSYKIWDWNTMPSKKYDGGLFKGNEEIVEVEVPQKEYLSYEEIFKLYNNRFVIDKNGMELLVKNGKFQFPSDENAINNLKNKYPQYKKVVKINQVLWDWKTMVNGQYDGGLFNGNGKEEE